MEAKQVQGIIEFALGVYMLLFAGGIVKLSENPVTNATFLRKKRRLFVFAAICLLVHGVTYIAGWYW